MPLVNALTLGYTAPLMMTALIIFASGLFVVYRDVTVSAQESVAAHLGNEKGGQMPAFPEHGC